MDLPIGAGDLIAGKYRVERQLGDGGMGVVVAAVHVKLGERRAIKMMRPEIVLNAESSRRFLREAQAAARLKSDHVAKVYDVDELDDGVPYMVMEYLEGADLAAVLASGGALPPAEAVLYVRQACAGLAEAHAAKLVHRDIKPSNLFLTQRADGAPSIKVLDFGIAKAVHGDEGAKKSAMTARGLLLGTAAYMSPEQMDGEVTIDARTDIWSLGVTLFELLSGKLPFEAEGFMKLYGLITEGDPRPLLELAPDTPPDLAAIVLRCLAKSRDDRPATALDLSTALAPFSAAAGAGVATARAVAALQARRFAPTALAPAASAEALQPTVAEPARRADPARTPGSPPPHASRLARSAAAGAIALGVAAVIISLRSGAVAPASSSSVTPIAQPASASAAPTATAPPPRIEPAPAGSPSVEHLEPPHAEPSATAVPKATVKPRAPSPPRTAAPTAAPTATLAPRAPTPSRTEVNIP